MLALWEHRKKRRGQHDVEVAFKKASLKERATAYDG
jgi:hypothetical protein